MHSGRSRFRIHSSLTLAILLAAAIPSPAQEPASNTLITAKLVESRMQEVRSDAELDEQTREALIEYYRQALELIETTAENQASAEAFAQAAESAPAQALELRQELEKKQADDDDEITLDLPDDISAREIDARLQKERANQAAVSAKLSDLNRQLAAEANRPSIVREGLLAANQRADKLETDQNASEPPGQSRRETEAKRWAWSAGAAEASSEIRMFDQELLSQSARLELIQAQRDTSARNLRRIEAKVVLLEQSLANRRRIETAQIIAESDGAAFGEIAEHPVIRDLLNANRELSDELQSLTRDVGFVEASTRLATDQLKTIRQAYLTARQRLEVAGFSQALGQVLHEQRRDLPDVRKMRRNARKRAERIAELGLRDIQLESEWRSLQDEPAYIETLLADATVDDREKLVEPVQTLVGNRRSLLKNTMLANSEDLRALGELDFQEDQLQTTTSEFDEFLTERLLWVRSKKAVGLNTLLVLPGEIIAFLNPRIWLGALRTLVTDATDRPWMELALVVSGLLFWKRKTLRVMLQSTSRTVGRPAVDSFLFTGKALGITILLSIPWPLLTLASGWELRHSLDASEAVKAIGFGLQRITPTLLILASARVLCAEGGLADSHFRWPASATAALRAQFGRLMLTFMLPVFVLATEYDMSRADFGGELARIAFVLASAGVMVFLFRLLRSKTGIFESIRRKKDRADELSWIWLLLGAAVPVAYAVAAMAGFLYSAVTLMGALVNSLNLLFGLVVLYELAVRWLLVISGRLQYKLAMERFAAEREERLKASREDPDAEKIAEIPEPEIDVAGLGADTRKLLRVALFVIGFVGLAGIWSDLLPALSVFREITLWEYLDGAEGQQKLVPVTLADFLLALVYGFVTIIATRTVPSLLDVIMRQRGTITQGTRLAYSTLARYSIVLIGISLIAGTVGFNWGKIQWLVAALGVGIGFGLQEIIANFISGLIILVERPIRIGDLVTVGDTSGQVTRMQIRATTIRTFDRQELLVPNKEFVTGRVLNWSLSDEVIRLVIRVGVAYGSDMDKALALVRQAAKEEHQVLDEPPPLITFDEFGDNTLVIMARCFIPRLDKRREVLSDMNLAINRKFNEAGIVIAFPQRDVHFDAKTPLNIRIQTDKPASDPA